MGSYLGNRDREAHSASAVTRRANTASGDRESTATSVQENRSPALQPRIARLALEREHPEHTLVDAPQRLAPHEAFERLETERELAPRERTLRGHRARAQPAHLVRRRVVRPVDDAQILAAAALDRRLHEAPATARDEVHRLHDDALAAGPSQLLPPRRRGPARSSVAELHGAPRRRHEPLR